MRNWGRGVVDAVWVRQVGGWVVFVRLMGGVVTDLFASLRRRRRCCRRCYRHRDRPIVQTTHPRRWRWAQQPPNPNPNPKSQIQKSESKSKSHLHSATYEYLDGCVLRKQYTWLLAMRSWAIRTCRVAGAETTAQPPRRAAKPTQPHRRRRRRRQPHHGGRGRRTGQSKKSRGQSRSESREQRAKGKGKGKGSNSTTDVSTLRFQIGQGACPRR